VLFVSSAEFSVVSFSPLSCHHIFSPAVCEFAISPVLLSKRARRNDARGTNESTSKKRAREKQERRLACVNSFCFSLYESFDDREKEQSFMKQQKQDSFNFLFVSLSFKLASSLLLLLEQSSLPPVKLHYNPETLLSPLLFFAIPTSYIDPFCTTSIQTIALSHIGHDVSTGIRKRYPKLYNQGRTLT